ncbi:hypothetical protein [Burkholderia vietnamiensis]|uniref:hypothetical protein n=1 Tax=Burkholderia vietnamiensis TaxID=60552 RepID=UPI0026569853|nr:hypothetical protein [Burkholderia vietnamiensis]MDN8065929.1 hypothetical protein [Burkholderia vietnamiensis]
MAATLITWNDPATAAAQLAANLDSAGGVTVLVRVDTTNPHARANGPKYRSARFAPGAGGALNWFDANTGLNLYSAVTGWALPE